MWLKLKIHHFVLLVGVVLRVLLFFRNRPLWLDEATLALNLGMRSFAELLRPLDFHHTAPIAFLWAERTMVLLFGFNEYSLQVLPLICGIGLLWAIWSTSKRVFGPEAGLVALAIASMCPVLVYYANELKPYSIDALVAMLVVGWTLKLLDTPQNRTSWLKLTIGGILAISISQTAPFILAGAAVGVLTTGSVRKVKEWVGRFALLSGTWTVAFLLLFFFFYRPNAYSNYMVRFWSGTFLYPNSVNFGERLKNFVVSLCWWPVAPMLTEPSLWQALSLFVLMVIGAIAIWKRRGAGVAILLSIPIVCVYLAATFGLYAITGRLLIFLYPLVILFFTAAVMGLAELAKTSRIKKVLTGLVLLIVLIPKPALLEMASAHPARNTCRDLVAVIRNRPPEEAVYVYPRGLSTWLVYSTDWHTPDLKRLHWMIQMAGSENAPAFENRQRPSHAVGENEGNGLEYIYKGRREILGISTGFQESTGPWVPHQPDQGWSQHEAHRIAAWAKPIVWIYVGHPYDFEVNALINAITEGGEKPEYTQTCPDAAIYRFRFGSTSPQK